MNSLKNARLYAAPLSKGYWQDASRGMRDLRLLVFAALMIAGAILTLKRK